METLSTRSLAMAKTLRYCAKETNKPLSFLELADWWEYQSKLHQRREQQNNINFIVFMFTFPVAIYKRIKLDEEFKNWDNVFNGIECITKIGKQ